MYKKMLEYFLKKYKELHGKDYIYIKTKLGLVYMKLKRLNLKEQEFKSFIDWLYRVKKLSCLNFLAIQLNDFHASKEYRENETTKSLILHADIMEIRQKIIDKCPLCSNGFLNKINQCRCLKKFLKIRNKMRKECI